MMNSTETSLPPVSSALAYRCLDCGVLCDSPKPSYYDTRFGHAGIYSIACCPSCGLEQTVPRPGASELQHLYEIHYNFKGETNTRYTRQRERFLNSGLYRLWLAIDGDISFHGMKGQGRLLDIGCNEGRGLKLYQYNGFETEGLEFNSRAAAVARLGGFAVYSESLPQFFPKLRYDHVVLSNVLEHSLDPGEMLRNIHRILTDSGQLWLSCPNSQSWLRSLFGKFWINWHVPFHISHFSAATLNRQLEKSNFKVVEIKTETPAIWVTQSLLAQFYAQPGLPTLQLRSVARVLPLLIMIRLLLFPFLWLGNRLGKGDCLILVACKK